MNEPKFTLGPWEAVEVNKGEALIIQPCDTSRQPICLVDRTKNAWDNAHLIAAAPEMYEAMAEFVRRCDAGEVKSRKTYAQFKAILAKAEGKPQ